MLSYRVKNLSFCGFLSTRYRYNQHTPLDLVPLLELHSATLDRNHILSARILHESQIFSQTISRFYYIFCQTLNNISNSSFGTP